MPLTNTTKFRVRYVECDAYGHVNNANYLRYMQEAAFAASAAVGYDVRRYDEIGNGSIGMSAPEEEACSAAKSSQILQTISLG